MKKRLLAALLVLALMLGMTACGKQDGETTDREQEQTSTLADTLGYGYLAEYKELNLDLDWINSASTAGGKLYVMGDKYDEANLTNTTKLYCLGEDGSAAAEIPVPALKSDDTTTEYVQGLQVNADGSGYWMVTCTYGFGEYEVAPAEGASATADLARDIPAEEAEDDIDPDMAVDAGEAVDPDMAMDAGEEVDPDMAVDDEEIDPGFSVMPVEAENSEVYTAYKCDMNGNVLLTIDLSDMTAEGEYFYVQSIATDKDGNLLLLCDTNIYFFDAEGNRKENVAIECNWIETMTANSDGTVLISYYDDNGQNIAVVENGTVSAPMDLSATLGENFDATFYPGVDGKVYLSDRKVLYSLEVSTGTLTPLLNWLDSDINGNNIQGVVPMGDDTIEVLLYNWYGNGGDIAYEIATLKQTPLDQIPVRTTMTLGAEYLGADVTDAVINFNRKNDKIRITVVDYSQYNTDEDYTAASKQLDLDIVSGNAPDIVCLTTGHEQNYIRKGALANLTELMEKDSSISMEDLMSGPLKNYTKDGVLYAMPTGFSVMTMYGSAALLGNRNGWNMAEMAEIISALPDDAMVMNYYTQTDFVNTMVSQDMNQFVDYATMTCNFNTPEFKELLEAASRLPADFSAYETGDEDGMVWRDEFQLMQSGEVLLSNGWISGSYDLKNYYGLYTAENGIIPIGFPTNGGNGVLLSLDRAFAISSGCKDKEGAWSFVRSLLDDSYQDEYGNFPVTVSGFEAAVAKAMEQEYYLDENGEKVYYDGTAYIGDMEYPLPVLTQAQADDFKQLVNSAQIGGRYEMEIMTILSEETPAYFSGDKTADAVADLIQNRVSIYLGEIS